MLKPYAELPGLPVDNPLEKHRARIRRLSALIFFLLAGTLVSNLAKAQDQIVKKDKSIIQATVLEITDESVRYKLFDFPDGPIYNIKKADAFLIIYKNGRSESFAAASPDSVAVSAPAAASAPPVTNVTAATSAPAAAVAPAAAPALAATTAPPAAASEPVVVAAPVNAVVTNRSGKTPKKEKRVLVGLGAHEYFADIGAIESGLVVKLATETLGKKTRADGQTVRRNSGFGLAATGLLDISVTLDSETANFNKYYLSGYYFKEVDIKFVSLGVLVGPALNYTAGTLEPSSSSSSSGSVTDVSFFDGGLHTGQYGQVFFGKNAQGEKAIFLRFGFDQYFMVEGSLASTASISIGF